MLSESRPNEWWAMISPALTLEASGYLTTPHDAGRVLSGRHSIGNGALVLTAADRQLVEYIRTLQLGWMQSVSWPIVAEGQWTGSDWPASERDASKVLHKLCCLLSLLWNESWQVRVGPQRSDGMKPRLLDDSSPPEVWHRNDVPQRGLRNEVGLPEWFNQAWGHSYFDETPTTRSAALTLWREGKLLQPEHPTFALVAFTAALEQAARLLVQSGDLAASPATASGRFWATVDLVAEGSDAGLLRSAKVYELRSAAAHGERMPGLEQFYGPVLVPPFLSQGGVDQPSEFVHQAVRILADVARSALLRVFAGAL